MAELSHMTFDTDVKEEKELALEFINTLLHFNKVNQRYYLDIHMYQEESLIIIEWSQEPYSREWGGQFKYIDEDHVVMKEVRFPDGHYEYVFDDEEEDAWKRFHEENPGWVKTEYGTWTNEIENARLRKEFGIDKEDDK